MSTRSAIPTLTGFDFQRNAAIILMLENIHDMTQIRLEGDEDIDLTLTDDSHLLAQAKAIVQASTDFKNVRKNLKKGIESLSDGYKNCPNTKELIFITNSPNPLNEDSTRTIFSLNAHRKFNTLPANVQKGITDYLKENKLNFDTDLFKIQILPFETDDEEERYKFINMTLSDFVGRLNISLDKHELHLIWRDQIFVSGTKSPTITLSKSDIIWPVIVLALDTDRNNNYTYEFDNATQEEIKTAYSAIINALTNRFEFCTKVLSAFNSYKTGEISKERVDNFITTQYDQFLSNLDAPSISIDSSLKNDLMKIIIQTILDKRYTIKRIKEAVNL